MLKNPIGLMLVMSLAMISAASADKLIVKSGQGTLERPNVKIKSVEGDQLVFESSSGTQSRQALSTVLSIEATGEAAFNDAETAYTKGNWADAATAYQKAMATASKDWMRDRISLRLVDVAGKTGRFDLASAGYIGLLARNPSLAATVKPALPADKDPKAIGDAIAAADKAQGDSKLSTDAKVALLQFELEMQTAVGDKKGAAGTIEQILKIATFNPNDPAQAKQIGDFKIAVAQLALDNKDYAKAVSQIKASSNLFNDPQQQADALYILAEGQYQQALIGKLTDKAAWQDIAIAYMRVVASFKESPHAPDCLARTAACLEQMGNTKKALAVYQQLAQQFPDSPAAKGAQDAITRLKAAE